MANTFIAIICIYIISTTITTIVAAFSIVGSIITIAVAYQDFVKVTWACWVCWLRWVSGCCWVDRFSSSWVWWLSSGWAVINHDLVDSQLNLVGVRIYQCIRMIKQSKMRPFGGATFWDNHLPAITTILTPILVWLKNAKSCLSGGATFCDNHLRGCVIRYVGKSRLSCKRITPFSCHLIGSHFLRQSPAGHRHDFHPFFSLS